MTLNVNSSSVSELYWLQQQEAAAQTSGTQDSGDEAISFTSGDDSDAANLEDIESEYMAAEAEYAASTDTTEETDSTDETDSASSSSSVNSSTSTGSTSGATSEEIQEEIDKLEEEKEENIEKMEEIEANIEKLADSAEKNIMQAAKAQEDAVSEHEEETQEVLDENLQEYINANKEGGEGMTRDELQENIKNALPNTPEIADAVAALTAASEEVDEIDANLSELNTLINDTQSIEEEIEAKQEEYDAAVAAEAAPKCCDPIGFTVGEGDEQAQYDFIVDDGSFDSTSDFLGADGNWSEMTALDTDGDNIVTAEELQAGNIKAVKTNADGSQEVVDLAEEFGDDFSIDLSSYEEGGSYSGIDTTTDSDGDGTADQSLLGTFDVNVDGETVSGYNTLDDTDWLSENYGLSSDDTTSVEYSEDLQPHVNFFNEYTAVSEELKSEIESGYEDLGISKEQMEALNETTQREADENAKNFFASLGLNEDDINTDTSTDSATSIEEEEEEEELLEASAA
ncbi:MAG: hypothetical protein LUH05_08380 [Candidatus Gastranaerophilales bacterium]|nr:hypothetical protein [Candidatus Gastranaerophilales bacterium]